MNKLGTPAPRPVDVILRPIRRFTELDISGGLLLIGCTLIAMGVSNSSLAEGWHHLWETRLAFSLGPVGLDMSLHHWINDGLMAIFFLVVGLEIKREVLVGDLSSPRKAALPVAAAAGGMLAPALIYTAINFGTENMRGWAIPTATDIAFALGVLSLLGSRVPTSLKMFLTALAVVDDLGAILIIALFYTAELNLGALGVAGGIVGLMILANRLGIRSLGVYGILAVALWYAFMISGIHATLAGVITAMTIPSTALVDSEGLVMQGHRHLKDLLHADGSHGHGPSPAAALHRAAVCAQSPMERLEHALLPYVDFVIMPVFALANAGVHLSGGFVETLGHPVGLGVAGGLILGKQLGIFSASWLAVRAGLGQLPPGVSWKHIYGAACLGGIGFTMSLFVSGLSFEGTPTMEVAKLAILTGSVMSASLGATLLYHMGAASAEAGGDGELIPLPVASEEPERGEARSA